MSRHRVHIPMYALTSRLATQRKMALYRNVRAAPDGRATATATPRCARPRRT